MALVTQKTVYFYTDNACVDQAVSETIRYFIVNK